MGPDWLKVLCASGTARPGLLAATALPFSWSLIRHPSAPWREGWVGASVALVELSGERLPTALTGGRTETFTEEEEEAEWI